MRTTCSALLALSALSLALSGTASAATLRCGALIDHDVRLDADLVCHSGEAALQVVASGVRIDLNGHSIRGAASMDGIQMYDVRHVQLLGPGRIEGFSAGIYAARTRDLDIQAVDFVDLDTGAMLLHSAGVKLRDAHFERISGIAVNLMQPQLGPDFSNGGHVLSNNQFAHVGQGIQLCGIDSGHALIEGNRFAEVETYGIHLADGSSGNRIQNNRFDEVQHTAIEIEAGSRNRVLGNAIADGRFGIGLSPRTSGFCETGGSLPAVSANELRDNRFSGLEQGVRVGLGNLAQATASDTAITGNVFSANVGDVMLLGDSQATWLQANQWDAYGARVADYSNPYRYRQADYGYFSR